MEPLKQNVRDALKQAHTGLTDEEIDQHEKLLAERFLVDPEADPLRIQEIDQQRAELLHRKMPKLTQVLQKICGEDEAAREGN